MYATKTALRASTNMMFPKFAKTNIAFARKLQNTDSTTNPTDNHHKAKLPNIGGG
jgi:hypothetical protein